MNQTRLDCRSGQACVPTTLAEALHCLVQHGDLSVEELVAPLADRFGVHVSRAQLYEWSNAYRSDPNVRCPLRVVDAIQQIQGSSVLLAFLAQRIGYTLDVVPAGEHTDTLEREFLESAAAVGELAHTIRVVTADRRLSADERQQLQRDIFNAKRELADVEAAVARM